jgi:hypothetical protein
MSSHTKSRVQCLQCDQTEGHCECDRYCCLCYSDVDIRMCHDGLYYCLACREACDYKLAE